MRISIMGTTDEMVEFLSKVTVDEWSKKNVGAEDFELSEPIQVISEGIRAEESMF